MKKLVLFIIIAALCMVPVIASAQSVQGTYHMMASGSCIHSQNGYYDQTTINPVLSVITAKPGIVYSGTTVLEGTWTFDAVNHTGTLRYSIYATVTPPPTVPPPGSHGPPVSISGGIRVFNFTSSPHPFHFQISGEKITVMFDNDSDGPDLTGSISIDGDTIILPDVNNVQELPAPYWWTICNTARTLIRVSED